MKNLNFNARFNCYEGVKFAQIMSIANVSPEDVLESLEANINRKNVFKAG